MSKYDHHRISSHGKAVGDVMARVAEKGRARLAAQGLTGIGLPTLRDEMCTSCACRPGTVPNGCAQTQMDFLKAVVEGIPFYCHAPKDGRLCAGWAAARAEHAARPMPPEVIQLANEWEFSPPDEPSQ